jgi:hypothetical protein
LKRALKAEPLRKKTIPLRAEVARPLREPRMGMESRAPMVSEQEGGSWARSETVATAAETAGVGHSPPRPP